MEQGVGNRFRPLGRLQQAPIGTLEEVTAEAGQLLDEPAYRAAGILQSHHQAGKAYLLPDETAQLQHRNPLLEVGGRVGGLDR